MRRRKAFGGIQILDYVLMNNHFHLVCKVPEPKVLTQSEMLARIEAGDGSSARRRCGINWRAALSSPMALSRVSACWNAIGGGCTTSRFLTKSSKAAMPSPTIGATDVTVSCGPTDSRASYWKEAVP